MLSRGIRVILVVLLLGAGAAACWKVRDHARLTTVHLTGFAIALAAALLPAVRDRLDRWLNVLRRPSPPARRRTMAAVFVLSTGYLLATALGTQQRDLIPKFHDEHMHLL